MLCWNCNHPNMTPVIVIRKSDFGSRDGLLPDGTVVAPLTEGYLCYDNCGIFIETGEPCDSQ